MLFRYFKSLVRLPFEFSYLLHALGPLKDLKMKKNFKKSDEDFTVCVKKPFLRKLNLENLCKQDTFMKLSQEAYNYFLDHSLNQRCITQRSSRKGQFEANVFQRYSLVL